VLFRLGGKGGFTYSFAKTPLKAAQAPLAAASASQGVVMRIIEGFGLVDDSRGLKGVGVS